MTETDIAAKVSRGTVKASRPSQERPRMPQEGRSKYRSVPTEVDGIRFHSAKEARRYGELKFLEKIGEIRNLRLQPKYSLNVQDYANRGEVIGYYIGDFAYEHDFGRGWDEVVEDVKGFKTPLYRWKKKHFEAQYGLEIREI